MAIYNELLHFVIQCKMLQVTTLNYNLWLSLLIQRALNLLTRFIHMDEEMHERSLFLLNVTRTPAPGSSIDIHRS